MKTEKEIIKEHYSKMGSKCLKTMTKEQRSERAKKANKVRWAKKK